MKNLNIIMNERIYKDQYSFYSENVDCKSIVEGLKERFNIKLFARKTKVEKKINYYSLMLVYQIIFLLFYLILFPL